MQKVLITVSRGSIARNLLQNDFYKLLREKFEVVMLTTAAGDPRFVEEFSHPNVRMVPLGEDPHGFWDRIIFFFHKYLAYNSTIEQTSRFGIVGDSRAAAPPYLLYIVRKSIFLPLSKIRILRDVVRLIDFYFLQKEEVAEFRKLLVQEKPAVVIVTNISDDLEAALLKAARRESIPSIAIPKTWDNLSNHGFRARSDVLVVWSEFMRSQATTLHNYKSENVRIIGVPQFDYYTRSENIWTREKFCALYGLDPSRKIVVFGSEGKLFPTDAEIADIIATYITEDHLVKETSLLVRPHYAYRNDEKKFDGLRGREHVSIDYFNNPSNCFRDHWDYSQDFMLRFLNTLYHADIMINTASTLSLDGVAFGRPIVNIAFGGVQPKKESEGIAGWYNTDYYRAILAEDATTLVYTKEALLRAINEYLSHPELKSEERRRLFKRFCYILDGNAGRRFFDLIVDIVAHGNAQ